MCLNEKINCILEKIEELGKQMQGLRNQVEDLIDDKTKRDQELEELAKALDSRVQLWKVSVQKKDLLTNLSCGY
jgi:hypothetical protein